MKISSERPKRKIYFHFCVASAEISFCEIYFHKKQKNDYLQKFLYFERRNLFLKFLQNFKKQTVGFFKKIILRFYKIYFHKKQKAK